MPSTTGYGTWTSPITAADAAAAGGGPQWLDVVGDEVWLAQTLPAEGGRTALVRAVDGQVEEVLPAPWNARNRVHEYGGKPWTVAEGTLAFTHWDDQRVYTRDLNTGRVEPITQEPDTPHGTRYGDLRPGFAGEVFAVRETSTGERRTDIARDLVAIPLAGGQPRSLAANHHFLTAPQLSPDGAHVAWLGWDHPAMPWDGTRLYVARTRDDGTFGQPWAVAGGPDVAVCQLEWEGPASLLALLDPEDWWNVYRVALDGTAENLAPVAEELGGALWKIGSRWFARLDDTHIAVLSSGRLAVLDAQRGAVTEVGAAREMPAWSPSLAPHAGGVVGIAAGPRRESGVVHVDPDAGSVVELTTPSEEPLPDPAYLPTPRQRMFTSDDGEAIPAYVYPPTNPDHVAPEGDLPPYLVHVHGGPTGRNYPVLDMDFAYFTSRGFGVVAVDYGGSTGYGRRYRARLHERWGVVDVADCVAVARALADEGTADRDRMAIRGGSAGGFTSAAAMTTVRTFRAATIKFPILDLGSWTGGGGETHDFESRYLDGLIGPLPGTEQRYRERSPMHHAHALAGPVLFLQGLEDEICPPEQVDRFVAALRGSGIPHGYRTFAGEQHGFRKAETMIAALEAELAFYGQVFGFDTPGVAAVDLHT